MLPITLVEPLENHLLEVKALHKEDLLADYGRVELPYAFAAKYPRAAPHQASST